MGSQIPPFYVGQEVEAIRNHSQGCFKKGDRFIVSGYRYACCTMVITIGIKKSRPLNQCVCGAISHSVSDEWEFAYYNFRALNPQFEAISFTKVLETELVSNN